MSPKYAREDVVHHYECDSEGRMTLQNIITAVVEVSGEHANLLNETQGKDIMAEHGLSWIITQYEINITRLPQVFERITIETEVSDYTKLFARRYFRIYDKKGEQLLEVIALFTALDLEKRKIARLPEILFSQIDGLEQVRRIERLPKLEKLKTTLNAKDYEVRYFDIDTNKHVNNAVYLEWSLDSLGAEFLQTHDISYANVKFEKEVYYGDVVKSAYNLEVNGEEIKSIHRISSGDVTNCELNYRFKKR